MTAGTIAIHELDMVELVDDLPNIRLEFPDENDSPLRAGDRGTVVFAYDPEHFIVEFFRNGETIAVADVAATHLRRVVQEPDENPTMHIEFALLAEHARFLPKRTPRFNVVGGGLWTAETATLPANTPNMTAVIGVGYTQDGLDRDHLVEVRFVTPDGARIGPGPNAHYNPSRTVTHPRSSIGMESEGIVDVILVPYKTPYFTDYGRYEVRISLDGKEAKTLYFTLTRAKS